MHIFMQSSVLLFIVSKVSLYFSFCDAIVFIMQFIMCIYRTCNTNTFISCLGHRCWCCQLNISSVILCILSHQWIPIDSFALKYSQQTCSLRSELEIEMSFCKEVGQAESWRKSISKGGRKIKVISSSLTHIVVCHFWAGPLVLCSTPHQNEWLTGSNIPSGRHRRTGCMRV